MSAPMAKRMYQLRAEEEQLDRWQAAADASSAPTLAAWMRVVLDKAAGKGADIDLTPAQKRELRRKLSALVDEL